MDLLNRRTVQRYWQFSLISLLLFTLQSFAERAELDYQEYKNLINQAKKYIVQKKFTEAYYLLAPDEQQLAGDPEYDYLFGTAALEKGDASLAVMVLQRVIDTDENYAGARLELATAYFQLGDYERARYHFKYLQMNKPPTAITEVIDKYLLAIDRRASKYESKLIPSLELGSGYDSNANGATDFDSFLGFPLDDNSKEKSSSFWKAAAGLYYSHPYSTRLRFTANGKLAHRANPSASFVNQNNGDINAGVEWSYGKGKIAGNVGSFYSQVDGNFNFRTSFVNISANIAINDKWKFIASSRFSKQHFEEQLSARNVDQSLYVIGLQGPLGKTANPNNQFSVSYLNGEDDATEDLSPFSNDRSGIQLAASYILNNNLLLTASAAQVEVDYRNNDVLFFGEKRKDTQKAASAGLIWLDKPADGWQIMAQVSYTESQSNITIYDSDRSEFSLTIRKNFE